MNIQEAIKHCKEKVDCSECGKEHAQLAEWLEEYKKLKERDRAKTVTDVHLDEYYCPACGAENSCSDGKVEDKFCPRCGQRIDWSEEEEHEN